MVDLRTKIVMLLRDRARSTHGLIGARLAPEDVKRFERRLDRLVNDFRAREVAEGAPFRLAAALWRGGDPRA
ncbi:MAG: hypothetical protein WD249_08135 [Gaiellaceae bacterium]